MSVQTQRQESGRITRILKSHSELPVWVQFWMNFILGPINLATLAFLNEPSGGLIATLALSGMAFTMAIVYAEAGFTKAAAAGHVVPWTALVLLLAFARPDGSAIYQAFLTALLVINAISLAFDFNDLRVWRTARTAA